jgi:hypothetical protein
MTGHAGWCKAFRIIDEEHLKTRLIFTIFGNLGLSMVRLGDFTVSAMTINFA